MLRSWASFSESSACMDPDDESAKEDAKEGQSPSRLQSSRGSWGDTPRIRQVQPPIPSLVGKATGISLTSACWGEEGGK